MTKETRKQAKYGKLFKMPKKVLIKMRDFYVHSMTKCDANVNSYGGGMGGSAAQFPSVVPRSFSTSSCATTKNDEDLKELIRIASSRSLGEKVEAEIIRRRQSPDQTGHGVKVVPRSVSVAIGRIDEDKACEFEDEVKVRTYVYPRSRSYAVTKRSSIV